MPLTIKGEIQAIEYRFPVAFVRSKKIPLETEEVKDLDRAENWRRQTFFEFAQGCFSQTNGNR